MIKQIAWNTFKNTGNIDTMMELIEVEKAMRNNEIIKKENLIKVDNEKKDILQ